MRILVIGAGGVGSAFATIAASRPIFTDIVLADIDAGIVEARAKGDTAKLAELEAGRRLVTAVGVPGANVGVTDKIADVNHPCGIRRHASQLSRFSETLFVERRLLGAEPRPRGRTLTITSD